MSSATTIWSTQSGRESSHFYNFTRQFGLQKLSRPYRASAIMRWKTSLSKTTTAAAATAGQPLTVLSAFDSPSRQHWQQRGHKCWVFNIILENAVHITSPKQKQHNRISNITKRIANREIEFSPSPNALVNLCFVITYHVTSTSSPKHPWHKLPLIESLL